QQTQQLRKSVKYLKAEGFRHIHILKSLEDIEAVTGIKREKLYNDNKDETGPFDIIVDVHGCFEELKELLTKLGYEITQTRKNTDNFGYEVTPPENRKAIFVGDLVDKGPSSPEVLRLVMSMVNSKTAYCVPGNHDSKL